MLVVEQLSGVWKCKADNLTPLYEQGLSMVRRVQDQCFDGFFQLAHVYREYNVDADSRANIALDHRTVNNSVVVDEHWSHPNAGI